jgi:hypothetical protein
LLLTSGYGYEFGESLLAQLEWRFPNTTPARLLTAYLAGASTDFYTVTGDITEYFYQMRDEKYPSKKLLDTCFEFGTFGDSLPAQIRSIRAPWKTAYTYMAQNRSPAATR